MRRDDTIRILKQHRHEFARFGVQSLALFGSIIRDESRPDSDIDVLVDFAGRATLDQFMGLEFYLEDLLGCRVDLVTRKALKPRLKPYIEREAFYVT